MFLYPKIFKTKINKSDELKKKYKDGLKTNYNSQYKPKHFPPFTTEFTNTVYNYKKDTIKMLPTLDLNIYNIIKSYFNLYMASYNKKTRIKRRRIRINRYSTNKVITSKPNFTYTNDKVNITVHTYNRSSINFEKKMLDLLTIDKIRVKKDSLDTLKYLIRKYLLLENNLNKFFNVKYLRCLIMNRYKLDFNNINKAFINFKVSSIISNKNYIFYTILNNFIKKTMSTEIASIRYKQCMRFEQSKYEEQNIKQLIHLLEYILRKKVVLDIVNLKYFYNSSSIFSDVLLTKLKMKNNNVSNVLGLSLEMFDIPGVDNIKTYSEIYNRERFIQNSSINNIAIDNSKVEDKIDEILSSNSKNYSFIGNFKNLKYKHKKDINGVIYLLKNKFTKGLRIEVAGRLTKRNTAQRSVYKLKYKGNIKNLDSSVKNLSTVLLRGHSKSNLVYTQSRSKLRVGAFGLKTWVSSD